MAMANTSKQKQKTVRSVKPEFFNQYGIEELDGKGVCACVKRQFQMNLWKQTNFKDTWKLIHESRHWTLKEENVIFNDMPSRIGNPGAWCKSRWITSRRCPCSRWRVRSWPLKINVLMLTERSSSNQHWWTSLKFSRMIHVELEYVKRLEE